MTFRTRIKFTRKSILLLLLVMVLVVALYPPAQQTPIVYIERETGRIKTEKVPGEKWLVWLYYNPFGKATLQTLVKRKFVSAFYGKLMDRPASVKKISPFVADYHIDLNSFQAKAYHSFNDFFTRKLKAGARQIDTDSLVIVSPGDGKMLVIPFLKERQFLIKGLVFDLAGFLNDPVLARRYEDGSMVILRLSPADYHRFHFPVDGRISPLTRIKGDYYSVSPLALRKITEIFCRNKRDYVTLTTPHAGKVIMAEVGATMVGTIVQTFSENMAIKGREKGYFRFGGSSVVLLFEKGKVEFDKDLIRNTHNKFETEVETGERIGICLFP